MGEVIFSQLLVVDLVHGCYFEQIQHKLEIVFVSENNCRLERFKRLLQSLISSKI